MKNTITFFLLLMFSLSFANAQTIEEAIKGTLTQFESSMDNAVMLAASNRFDLIANKWPADWVGHYYSAYAKVMLGTYEKDKAKKGAYFEEAEKQLETAKLLVTSENEEIAALSALIANMKIGLYPEQWQKYIEQFSANLQKAKNIRKDNPRIYYIEGLSKFYTPEAYGGGKKVAISYFEKADDCFKLQPTDDIRKPYWGSQQNSYFLKRCKE